MASSSCVWEGADSVSPRLVLSEVCKDLRVDCEGQSLVLQKNGQILRPNSHRMRTRNTSKWDLLLSMGVFTLLASNIKGKMFYIICVRVAWRVLCELRLTGRSDTEGESRVWRHAGNRNSPSPAYWVF